MIRTILATALLALGIGAASAAPILRSEVMVTAAIVTVGDMFEDAGAYAEQALFRAPAPGTTGIVDIEAVRKATGIVGLTDFIHDGVLRVRVSRAATVVDQAALTALIVTDLQNRGIVTGEVFAQMSFDTPNLSFNAEAVANPATLISLRYMPSGTFTARFLIAGTDRPADVTGRIELMIETPHLVSAMRAGEVIEPDDIEMKPVPLTQAETYGITRPEELIGKALTRQSRAGLMLRPSDVAVPELVSRSEVVTVFYRNGAMTLTVKGQALTGAAEGEALQVLNLMSKKILTAVAIGDGAVEIVATQHVAGL